MDWTYFPYETVVRKKIRKKLTNVEKRDRISLRDNSLSLKEVCKMRFNINDELYGDDRECKIGTHAYSHVVYIKYKFNNKIFDIRKYVEHK